MKFYYSTTTLRNYAIKGAVVSCQSKRTENRGKLDFSNFYASVFSSTREKRRGLSEYVRFKREKSASHGRSLHKNVEFRLHSALIPFACLLNAAFVFSPCLALFFSLPLLLLLSFVLIPHALAGFTISVTISIQ